MVMIVATKTLRKARYIRVVSCTDHADKPLFLYILTNDRHPIDLFHSTRQSSEETNNKANHAKDKSAGTVISQYVHQNIESQDIAGHEEDQQQELANSEHLAADATHQEFASVSHAVDVGVTELELSNGITGIPGQGRDEKNHDSSTVYVISQEKGPCLRIKYTRNHAKSGNRRGERQDSNGDVLRNHDYFNR